MTRRARPEKTHREWCAQHGVDAVRMFDALCMRHAYNPEDAVTLVGWVVWKAHRESKPPVFDAAATISAFNRIRRPA